MTKPVMKKSQIKLWFLIPLLAFIAFIIMLAMRLGQSTEVVIDNSLNRPVPVFELPLLSDTSRIVGNEVMPNQPYLINVWGSWCITCVQEHPFLLELHQDGVTMVGVNYDDELESARTYLAERQDPFAFSLQDSQGALAVDLGLTGAPETFVVDWNGNIRQHIVGAIDEINWQQRIEPCFDTLNEMYNSGVNLTVLQNQQRVAMVCV